MNLREIRKKATSGSVSNQSVLGLCYLHGHGIRKNHQNAFKWLSLAAEKGAARAVLGLGYMYENGLHVQVNMAKAIELYRRASKSGEFAANVYLARIYAHGKGVRKNKRSAKMWYQKALDIVGSVDAAEETDEARNYLELDHR